jgi:hypothetical protein
MGPVLLSDPAGEERRDQLVALDPVVEGVDQALERGRPTGPFIQRRGRVWVGIGDVPKANEPPAPAPEPARSAPLSSSDTGAISSVG